mgnify:CR=1 FL=1
MKRDEDINKNGEKKMRLDKKGQFKIQQMAFMLVGVVLFFMLVALFWITISYQSIQEEATKMRRQEAESIAHFLSGSSEFNCPEEDYCIDTDKLMVLANIKKGEEFKIIKFDWS